MSSSSSSQPPPPPPPPPSPSQHRSLPGFLRRSLRLHSTTTGTNNSSHSNNNGSTNDTENDISNNEYDENDDDDGDVEDDTIHRIDDGTAATFVNYAETSQQQQQHECTDTTTIDFLSPLPHTTMESSTIRNDMNDININSRKQLLQSKQSDERNSSDNNNNNNNDSSNSNFDLVEDAWIVNNNNKYDSNNNKKSYREQQYDKILNMEVINMTELRSIAWNGIPIPYRAMVWKLLLGYCPTNRSRRNDTIQRKRHEYDDAVQQYYYTDDDDNGDDNNNTNNNNNHHRTVQEQETLRQVLVDVPRTQPTIGLFRNDRIKRCLSRLLYIWAIRHPASSYVQGINDLVTPLFTIFLADYFVNPTTTTTTTIPTTTDSSSNNNGNNTNIDATFDTNQQQQQQQYLLQQVLDGHVMNHCSEERLRNVEADVYWCITNLLSSIQDHYTADQPGVQRMVGRLEELVYRIDKDLTIHIRDDIGIQFLQFSFKWMNCLLLREFHLKCVFRLWDTYLSEKNGFEEFHVYVCAAFMCQFSHLLQTMNFDEVFGFMQDIPTTNWTDTEIEVLLSQAFVLSTLFKGSDAHLTK